MRTIKILLLLLICTCLSAYSKDYFVYIKDEVNTWLKSAMYSGNNKVPKSIDFTTQKYSINGIMTKGRLCEGTIAKFYDTTSLVPYLLLEGKVAYHADRLVIEGIRYTKTETDTCKLYGTFYVFNMDDFTINYKPKKAGDLRIKRDTLKYLEGTYQERPVIVRMNVINFVYVGAKNGWDGYSFLSAVIPNITLNEDDSFDSYKLLLQAEGDVTIRWENGTVFRGKVKPTPKENGLIVFYPLDGEKTGMNMGPQKITVSHENGDVVYTQYYGEDNKLVSKESFFVKDNGDISESDYWNLEKILEHCYHAKRTYTNGNYFEGVIKSVISQNTDSITSTISTTATNGVFKYPNGDRFEGDVSSKSVGSFFIDGTTFFADGGKIKGNWLKDFKLKNNQWKKVYECENPSSARALAHRFMYSNNYPEYEYAEGLEYFDPSSEKSKSTYGCIIHDKAKNRYICKYRDSKVTTLVFAIDNKGYRKWEIVYNDGKPTYINEYAWYSNGVVESIKSYLYNTKNIYLSCYFFSDGKLRSAYLFGRGNTGQNIMRKSKESHPTFGDYTCKLYDLNGNYERSIDWKIGIGESLFGGEYVQKMAPAHLIFSELKPAE